MNQCEQIVRNAETLGVVVNTQDCGTRIIDCGVKASGSLEAGVQLARVCMSGLGLISIEPAEDGGPTAHNVHVSTRSPLAACMASQYAGWEIKGEKFFAMGSGPMRAAACREELFKEFDCCEKPGVCVGVLEASKLPPDRVCRDIAEKCGIKPERLTLCVARTASLAGTVQIVARSVETAMHKMHAVGIDLKQVHRAEAIAPLPPIAENDMQAVGWTNDAILYGAFVMLEISGDDATIESLGAKVPSCTSPDFGRPFAEIFAAYNNDFYKIDPMLFSPASLLISNARTGKTFSFGTTRPDLLAESFSKK